MQPRPRSQADSQRTQSQKFSVSTPRVFVRPSASTVDCAEAEFCAYALMLRSDCDRRVEQRNWHDPRPTRQRSRGARAPSVRGACRGAIRQASQVRFRDQTSAKHETDNCHVSSVSHRGARTELYRSNITPRPYAACDHSDSPQPLQHSSLDGCGTPCMPHCHRNNARPRRHTSYTSPPVLP